jgi:hypothetical protein
LANEHTIRTFNAADIEKYHKGQLSAQEMHDLEKAALDDPFLADAIEGYSTAGVNVEADLAELKQRLAEADKQRKVVPIAAPRPGIPWLRVAALLILIAGAGTMIYFLSTKEKRADIAMQPKAIEEKISAPASEAKARKSDSVVESAGVGTARNKSETNQNAEEPKTSIPVAADGNTASNSLAVNPSPKQSDIATKKEVVPGNPAMAFEVEPSGNAQIRKDKAAKTDDETATRTADKEEAELRRTKNFGTEAAKTNNSQARINYFRGRVTDENAKALPFANVTNIADSIGTYSDANGNFVLISPDTVLDVQVRSIGFTNNNSRLQNNVTTNKIVMQEDNSLPETVINNQRSTNSRARNNMVLEESEPVDGWANYDLYIANNLNPAPNTDRRQRANGQVELSFEVNDKGQPINITIEKHLCDSCDQEAIRLIKEGPKWKRNSRKSGRTSVTVAF